MTHIIVQAKLRHRGVRLAAIAAALCAAPTFGAEYIDQEAPTPSTAAETDTSMDHAFDERPLSERVLMKNLKQYLSKQPPFLRDTKFALDLRSYVFERRNSSTNKPEATVIGGRLALESGWWNNFSVGAAYYNSTELDADGPDTGLLAPGQDNINIWGEANLRYRFTGEVLEGANLVIGRQTLPLPFINKHDIRQVPASHEGIILSRSGTELAYVAGHLTEFKDYDSNEFVDMAEAAGAIGADEGTSVLGARVHFSDHRSLGAANYVGWDTFNTFFSEATQDIKLSDKADVKLAAQFTDQRSIGDELIGDFDTQQFAAKAALGWRGAVVTLGGSVVSDDAAIRKPWGGSPSYLSIQRLDFDRAGETAVLFGLSYNTDYFSSLGLSSYINIAHGWDAEDPVSGADLPDRTEYDLTVDYKPPAGSLQGLWVRARYNYIDIEGDGEKVHDFRLIVNYTLPFL